VTRARRPWLYFGPAALVAGGLAVALTAASDHEQHPAVATALVLFVSWSFVIAGLIGWTRRPHNRTGKLMVGVGFGVLIGVLSQANYALPYTLGAIFGSLFIAAFVHLLLVYPSGELISRNGRILVGAAYVVAVLAPLLDSMFPARHTCKPNACPDDLVLVSHDRTPHIVTTAIWTTVAVLLFAAVVALLVGRWRRATPGLRRILQPVYLAGGLSVLLLSIGFIVTPFSGAGAVLVSVALIVTFTAVPFIFLAGILGTTIARGAGMGAIFTGVPERASPGEVQEGLRNALRDQTAVVAYWYEEGAHYVDVEGNRFDLPENTRRRVVTRLDYADAPVAAIVHDAALLQEPELLEGVANAARIALERDKLLVDVRARAKRYRALLQAMPDLMFRISRNGTYNAYNAPNSRDLVTDDVVGLTLWDRLPDELADRVLAAGRAALAGEPGVIEYEIDFPEGARHYEGRFAASADDEFLMIVREITDRKQQQEELEASRQRIVAAGDAARRKLERNLHDGAQQRLVSLSLSLRLAQNQLRKDPGAAEQLLEASREELGQALEELRELARGIHPAVLTDRGLGAALDTLASRAPLPVEIDCVQHGELPAPVEAAAYYVVSEALTNVTKYAEASVVKVTVGRVDGTAFVEVADDGVGGADPSSGSGLSGLADRVASLSGKLEIDSPPGAGTRVRAEIPLE
jgi:signal transduction histidine kinase